MAFSFGFYVSLCLICSSIGHLNCSFGMCVQLAFQTWLSPSQVVMGLSSVCDSICTTSDSVECTSSSQLKVLLDSLWLICSQRLLLSSCSCPSVSYFLLFLTFRTTFSNYLSLSISTKCCSSKKNLPTILSLGRTNSTLRQFLYDLAGKVSFLSFNSALHFHTRDFRTTTTTTPMFPSEI